MTGQVVGMLLPMLLQQHPAQSGEDALWLFISWGVASHRLFARTSTAWTPVTGHSSHVHSIRVLYILYRGGYLDSPNCWCVDRQSLD